VGDVRNLAWWGDTPPSFVPEASLSLLRHKVQLSPLRLVFYHKRQGYVRLQASHEGWFFESYLAWDQWRTLCESLEAMRATISSREAFARLCDAFRLSMESVDFPWIQVFSHGEMPLWVFPAENSESLWEFFVPVAGQKSLSGNGRCLVIVDESLAWAKEEVHRLREEMEADVVRGDFLFAVMWPGAYRTLHVISHGQGGSLVLRGSPLSMLPVQAEDLVFFHACEVMRSSHSMASHVLARGTRHVIAAPLPVPDDGKLLPSVGFFYRLYQTVNARMSFHLTSLLYPEFKQAFRLMLPYVRQYTP